MVTTKTDNYFRALASYKTCFFSNVLLYKNEKLRLGGLRRGIWKERLTNTRRAGEAKLLARRISSTATMRMRSAHSKRSSMRRSHGNSGPQMTKEQTVAARGQEKHLPAPTHGRSRCRSFAACLLKVSRRCPTQGRSRCRRLCRRRRLDPFRSKVRM